MQAQFVVDHVPQGANVVLINGEQFCDACRAFKRGSHAVLDEAVKSGRIKLVFEGEAKGWIPANAQALMEQALTLTDNQVAGVVAANDGLAQGVIAALTNVGLNGKVIVTGQDATDAGLTNILAGDQTMTVYKALQQQAGAAAKAAVALAKGGVPTRSSRRRSTTVRERWRRCCSRRGGHGRQHPLDRDRGRLRAEGQDLRRTGQGQVQLLSMSAEPTVPLLDVRGVTKRFGSVEALGGVDLTVHAAEVVALLGDNGAGKSTLIKAIAGVHEPDSGEIRFEGRPVRPSPMAASTLGIATVYQDLALCDNLTVVENLFLGRELRAVQERAAQLASRASPDALGGEGRGSPARCHPALTDFTDRHHVRRPASGGRRGAGDGRRLQGRHPRLKRRRSASSRRPTSTALSGASETTVSPSSSSPTICRTRSRWRIASSSSAGPQHRRNKSRPSVSSR